MSLSQPIPLNGPFWFLQMLCFTITHISVSCFLFHRFCPIGAFSNIFLKVGRCELLLENIWKDNICLHEDYPQEKIDNVVMESGLSEFISELPEGLLYQVGENGANLSGGQKQRIAVARALIRNKPILILDEGTSAVDMQTAYDIENRLLKINDLTIITITHHLRKELLEKYDEIICMDNGKIIEKGTFNELASNNSIFLNNLN